MREAAATQKLNQAVGSPPARHGHAAAFQTYVLVASTIFVGLAVTAHFVPYFSIDLPITRALQSHKGGFFDGLMHGMSWLGFPPQVQIIQFVVVAALYGAGLRWEAIGALFVAGNAPLGILIKLVVMRPRPGADLVDVASQLTSSGFPSGHVLAASTFCGYFAFLAFTLLKPSWYRTLIISLFILFALLMGCSRIYLGQHWFSDVMGAYLLGSLYLALTIKLYRWGKPRLFRDQPVAPESGPAPASAAGKR